MGRSTEADESRTAPGEKHGVSVAAEQRRYSTYLLYGAWLGMGIMLLTYALYLSGAVKPYVPLEDVTEYWSQSSQQYLSRGEVPAKWGWIKLVGYGDFINFVGIALMGLLTVGGLLMLLVAYVRRRDWPFIAIVFVQLLVLAASISGVLT